MAKIFIRSLLHRNNVSPAVLDFPNAFFSFGATDGAFANLVTFNRTMNKAVGIETARTVMTAPARIVQNAGGFSSTNIYHVKGYTTTLVTNVAKVTCATDTQSSPTITFTTERRGPIGPLPPYLGRIYYFGGYQDTTSPSPTYRQETTYITTSTDTATNTTNIPAARHVGVSLFTSSNAWIIGGLTTGGGGTTSIYKWTFGTDSVSTLAAVDSIADGQGYGLNYSVFGYKVMGQLSGKNCKKFTYSTDTISTGSNGIGSDTAMFGGTQFVTTSIGWIWTGFRTTTFLRTFHRLTFSTETWVDESYVTTDASTGWVQGTSGF